MCICRGWPFAFWAGGHQSKTVPDKRETASDRTSSQSKVRPLTVRPVWLRRKSYIVLRARIFAPFKAHTKVATFGRHHKKGGAAFGRATSFVVSFVCAMTGASILALSTVYDLRLSKTRRTVVGRTFDGWMDGWMDGRSDAVSLLSGLLSKVHAFQWLLIPGQMASRHMGWHALQYFPYKMCHGMSCLGHSTCSTAHTTLF